MSFRTFTLAVACCLLQAPAFASPQRAKDAAPPPGTVAIPGGRTKIGSELKQIEKRILEDPQAQQRGNALLSETPRHTLKVDDFFLMVNQVTNEQYEAFVRATGHKPPEDWADGTLREAAALAFNKEQAESRKAIVEAGEKPPPRVVFDAEGWWNENWQKSEWSIPAGHALFPVRFVSHADARAYARWAGLRLMTEFEYQRAVRGDSESTFPWGDDFDPKKAGTMEGLKRRGQPYPVGSFRGGEKNGVYDLAGNVWEWTNSPFTAFKGYKPLKATVGKKPKREVIFEVPWDPDARVCVGGSYQNEQIAARATARRRTERIQTTDAVGFRCAATPRQGQDIAETVLATELPVNVRPDDEKGKVKYRTELVLALDRWTVADESEPADASTKDAATDEDSAAVEASAPAGPPPGYAVIEDYEYIALIPATTARAANQTNLRKDTVENGPAAIGVLTTTFPLTSPELGAGTYMVSFRGKGEPKRRKEPKPDPDEPDPDKKDEKDKDTEPKPEEKEDAKDEDVVTLEQQLGLDMSVDNFIFYDNTGKPLVAVPCPDNMWSYTRMSPGTRQIVNVEVTEGEGKDKIVYTEKWLYFEVMLEGLTSSKGFRYKLPLKFDKEVLELDWRK